ncbi:MAG: hypothetical protein HC848_01225 [Limnobacter sp.]|nr:hypothetical protein [Limnobacter sp.]
MLDSLKTALAFLPLAAFSSAADVHGPQLESILASVHEAQVAISQPVAVESVPINLDTILPPVLTEGQLPPISGRLLDKPNSSQIQTAEGSEVRAAEHIQLLGIVQNGLQRVAVINDGTQERIVGMGSFVLDAYKVVGIGSRSIRLAALSAQREGLKPLEIQMFEEEGKTP